MGKEPILYSYGVCSYGDCEEQTKQKFYGYFWCSRHSTILMLDGPLDPELYLRALGCGE